MPFPTENPAQEKGLIVGACPQTLPVQGYRDDQVWNSAAPGRFEGVRQQQPKRPVQVDPPLILEPMHRKTQGALIDSGGDDPVEGRCRSGAFFAKMVGTLFRGIGKGTAGAAGRGAGEKIVQAIGAEKALGEKGPFLAAEGTGGRQKEIQKAGQFA